MWKDKKTGKIFAREDFAEHRRDEAIRVAPIMFLYGMIGCFAFGYFKREESEHAFYKYLGMAVCANAAVTAFMFAMSLLSS